MSKNKLIIGRAIFLLSLIIIFGIIIINEKGGVIFENKAKIRIQDYIETNYSNISKKIYIKPIKYKNNEFTFKAISTDNKHHYFYIKYKKKKYIDTYKTDYEEGKQLFSFLNKKIEKDIFKKTNTKCSIHETTTLNNYTEKVQNQIIKEKNISSLKYYYIHKEFIINNWNEKEITTKITNFINIMNEQNITPKYYTINITSKEDITKSIEISNISASFPTNNNNINIIRDIINDDNSQLLKENKISYKYLNEEE